MLNPIRRQLLRQLTVVCSCTVLASSLTLELSAQSGAGPEAFLSKDPYSLSFKDFAHEATAPQAVHGSLTQTEQKTVTDGAIAMFERRVQQNSKDFASRAILGELYLRRASDEDHLESYRLAIDVLDEALRIQPDYEASRVNMAKALMSQHRFADAIAMATPKGCALADKCINLSLVADCHLELGNYQTARALLAELHSKEASPPVLARVARIEEIHGRSNEAIQLLETALNDLEQVGADQNEKTWYRWRLGSLLFDAGQLDQAESQVREALKHDGADEPCLLLLAIVSFAKGDSDRALVHMREALKIHASPPSLALMGDLYQTLGESEKANEWWRRAEACILEEARFAKEAHARETAMYYADHDLHLEESLELITNELAQRKDIYTYDAHAWILYKNGKYHEAKAAMKNALTCNSQDLLFDYHAAKIALALGEIDEAREHLQRIAAVNARFSILFSADIERLCKDLKVARHTESQQKNIQP